MNREELLKVAKPILFNTEMVQAILDGRKTATRRNPFEFVMKEGYNPDWSGYSLGEYYTGRIETGVCLYSRGVHDVWGVRSNVVKPKYKVGDILYVKETWQQLPSGFDEIPPEDIFIYKASDKLSEECTRWRPSIYMPKKAARIFLKVTNLRVERVQDITELEAIKEGVRLPSPRANYVNSFIPLWDSINLKRGYGWEANPWVWVIEFERAEVENAKAC